jgi:hypothetical protein
MNAEELNSHQFWVIQVLMYSTRTHVQETNQEDATCSKLKTKEINVITKCNFGKATINLLLDIAKSRLEKMVIHSCFIQNKGIYI